LKRLLDKIKLEKDFLVRKHYFCQEHNRFINRCNETFFLIYFVNPPLPRIKILDTLMILTSYSYFNHETHSVDPDAVVNLTILQGQAWVTVHTLMEAFGHKNLYNKVI